MLHLFLRLADDSKGGTATVLANPGLEQTYGFHIFDLDLVRTRYRQFCGLGPGSVVLRIDGLPAENLVSEFAE